MTVDEAVQWCRAHCATITFTEKGRDVTVDVTLDGWQCTGHGRDLPVVVEGLQGMARAHEARKAG